MEEAMIYRKKVEGFQERDNFPLTPSTLFREQSNGHLLNKENDESFTNAGRY